MLDVFALLNRYSTTFCDALRQLPPSPLTPLQATAVGLGFWLVLVRSQRWKKYNAIHRKYGPKWDNGKGTITPAEAQAILRVSMHYDMAFVMNYSLAFALFKTYAIPSISKLLLATKQLGSEALVSRRYADTQILLSAMVVCPISGFSDPDVGKTNQELGPKAQPAEDPRAMIAVARMNWIHSHYKIANRDYVYTLSLFILEPARWASRFGWRSLSPLEEYAYYAYWVDIGKKMNIQDVPDSLEAMRDFVEDYETKYMKPAQCNHDTALPTFNELLGAVPEAFGLRKFADSVAICLVDENVREAMILPEQSTAYHTFTHNTLKFVSFIQQHLLLPRSHSNPRTAIDYKNIKNADSCPRMNVKKSTMKPWYMPEPTGINYYTTKMAVSLGLSSDMPGPHLKSGGYRLEEVGPIDMENSGHDEVFKQAIQLQGCPITGPWSLEAREREK